MRYGEILSQLYDIAAYLDSGAVNEAGVVLDDLICDLESEG